MTFHEYVQLTKGESISTFDPAYSLGEWVEHVFSHYGNEHRLDSLNVYGIVNKADRHAINTRYSEFKGEKYILIDEGYIRDILRLSESIVTGWIPLFEVLCTSPEFIKEFNSGKHHSDDLDGGFKLYPKFGLLWNCMDEDELARLIEEIVMKFMIAHEIHHVLIDNGFITDENVTYNFRRHVGFDAIDDAIDYINDNPSFTKRFSDKRLLVELCCDRHAINLTWRDIMFSRGECSPLIFTTAIILAFSAMKFHFAKYQQDDIDANIDIQIRDLYAQALCTVYSDRFIYVANFDKPRPDRISILRVITPYYEQFALIIHDLALCYFSILCKTLNAHNLPADFDKIVLNFVLLQIDNETAATYRNEYFEIDNNVTLSTYIDRTLMIYDDIYKRTPFHETTFRTTEELTEQSAKKKAEEMILHMEARNQFITIFNTLENL